MVKQKGIFHIVLRSLSYNRKALSYQFILIALLTAVITGSLLTGFSVRKSLISSAEKRIGRTGLIISSGLRYFSPDLAERTGKKSGLTNTSLLETRGFSRNLLSGTGSDAVNIYGISKDFFSFLGAENIKINRGEVAINQNLATRLRISTGEEIVLKFRPLSDIPADSPFAPSNETSSLVLKVGQIINPKKFGNFSTAINQISPDNVFINFEDLFGDTGQKPKTNRILFGSESSISAGELYNDFRSILLPDDIGLSFRQVKKTGETEIISSRIFIDNDILSQIVNAVPNSSSVITYLANSVTKGDRSAPYSFVAAVNPAGQNIIQGNNIIINRWLAADLNVSVGDTVSLSWFSLSRISELEERTGEFIVSKIVIPEGIYADSLLMPEFPGIAGSASCSDWDAGVKIRMDRIREKDEKYWNEFRGTPKAFISYEKGKELWGSNFGPATAVRFPSAAGKEDIISLLAGRLEPGKCGFEIKNLKEDMVKAAKESVDFTTLFISLGFFLILSCIILLSLTITAYFESRQKHVSTLFALGFTNKRIAGLLITETGIVALSASFAGAIIGLLVNWLIIASLNSVWIGAVQTDTLSAFPGLVPVLSGFLITLFLILVFLIVRIRGFTKNLNRKNTGYLNKQPLKLNIVFLLLSGLLSLSLMAALFFFGETSASISFAAGGSLFISMILLWRQFVIGGFSFVSRRISSKQKISGTYYSFYPSRAVAPVLFIAAGLFAVIVTGINRLEITDDALKPAGGTGGYLLWAETAIPVKVDLNAVEGRKNFGLDESPADRLTFVQGRRSAGDDASCLNLNHVTSPPLLGINPAPFIKNRSFSFGSVIPVAGKESPWALLFAEPSLNTVYGFADQTVLEWGLKIKTGDTLKVKAESGQILNIIIAGGLKSSLFQGYLLIGQENFCRFFPSVPGNSVFLIEGNPLQTESYVELLNNRFENWGISVQPAKEKLASFFRVTNTYLSVFTVLGGFGMILGIIGLGFVLIRNFNFRKREFALMMATGFAESEIKRIIIREQIMILVAGVLTGLLSAIVSTLPSIRNGSDIPWISLSVITVAIIITGTITLFLAVRGINSESLISSLRRE
jgi:putative ABC transport system permease protein